MLANSIKPWRETSTVRISISFLDCSSKAPNPLTLSPLANCAVRLSRTALRRAFIFGCRRTSAAGLSHWQAGWVVPLSPSQQCCDSGGIDGRRPPPLSAVPSSPVSPPPSAAGPPPGSEEPPVPPELPAAPPSWPGLDRLGLTQAIGGLALGLIALFSSYDHLTFAGRNIAINQQWGIPLIAASVAIVFIDAELATGSRLRAARDSARAAEDAARAADETTRERHLASEERQRAEQRENEADRERNLASEERQRADRERNRATRSRKRQRRSLERLHQAAVLSARVQLDPSDTNRARLQTFLNLLIQTTPEDLDL